MGAGLLLLSQMGFAIYLGIKKLRGHLFSVSDLFVRVDLEGFEPSSKRGSNKLSTCLSLPSIFEHGQDQSHQPIPYPF